MPNNNKNNKLYKLQLVKEMNYKIDLINEYSRADKRLLTLEQSSELLKILSDYQSLLLNEMDITSDEIISVLQINILVQDRRENDFSYEHEWNYEFFDNLTVH